MKVSKIKEYSVPGYPTRDYLCEHPELLRYIPKRWQNNKLVLKSLALLIPLLIAQPVSNKQPPPKSRIAPLFIHGEGRASYGCVAVNPPVLLSEDEARQIIENEAKKTGIKFVADGLTLTDIDVPITYKNEGMLRYFEQHRDKNDNTAIEPSVRKGQLVLDGYDKKHNVAYEFVSWEDFHAWENKPKKINLKIGTSVSKYDYKAVAEHLRSSLVKKSTDQRIAVFYEPVAYPDRDIISKYTQKGMDWNTARKKAEKAVKLADEEELRAQVRDFISWLKAQGVI